MRKWAIQSGVSCTHVAYVDTGQNDVDLRALENLMKSPAFDRAKESDRVRVALQYVLESTLIWAPDDLVAVDIDLTAVMVKKAKASLKILYAADRWAISIKNEPGMRISTPGRLNVYTAVGDPDECCACVNAKLIRHVLDDISLNRLTSAV